MMRLPTVCLKVLTLTGTISAPQNEIFFCVGVGQFGQIFRNIKKVVYNQC